MMTDFVVELGEYIVDGEEADGSVYKVLSQHLYGDTVKVGVFGRKKKISRGTVVLLSDVIAPGWVLATLRGEWYEVLKVFPESIVCRRGANTREFRCDKYGCDSVIVYCEPPCEIGTKGWAFQKLLTGIPVCSVDNPDVTYAVFGPSPWMLARAYVGIHVLYKHKHVRYLKKYWNKVNASKTKYISKGGFNETFG